MGSDTPPGLWRGGPPRLLFQPPHHFLALGLRSHVRSSYYFWGLRPSPGGSLGSARCPEGSHQQCPIQALEVLTAAVEYGLTDLRKLCVDFISRTLTVDMACEALQAAVTYGQNDLRQRCLAFIELHTEEILKTQGFRELSDLGIVSILQSDSLTIDEVPLIQAVREWACVSSVVLDVPVSVVAQDAVRELRLVLLSPDELTTLERENAKDDLIPEIQIVQAWKFHALKKVSDSHAHHFQQRKGTLLREHHHYLDTPTK
ncbi:hypothetical protein GDO78_016551 [Eleutherodactylus coqui]|uniref:BACK domain-containing protein n=1 Tax=Eleutherodactylus coqui TaxID=57060 RepID=A0A8J6B9I6_ELECQ|nr:hypothetical protein GDO78_016551 [Eleutherodactylus coqui]